MEEKISSFEAEMLGIEYSVIGGEVYITNYCGDNPEFVVPEYIDDMPVVSLRAYCCSDNENLESLVIPFVLDRIEFGAFENCINLTKLTIKYGVKNIDKDAFENTGLRITKENDIVYLEANDNPYAIVLGKEGSRKDIHIDSRARMMVCHAFEETDIEEMRVAHVEFVGNYAFANCKKLKFFSLSLYTHYLGESALEGCEALETAVTHNITRINKCTFSGCKSLTTVTMNDPLLKICVGAFAGCESLETVLFPHSLNEIADGAFSGCKKLNMAKYKGDLESVIYFEMKNWKGEVLIKTADELYDENYGKLTKYLLDEENSYYITKHRKISDEERRQLKERLLARLRNS
jgi:hypothetical protein